MLKTVDFPDDLWNAMRHACVTEGVTSRAFFALATEMLLDAYRQNPKSVADRLWHYMRPRGRPAVGETRLPDARSAERSAQEELEARAEQWRKLAEKVKTSKKIE